MNVYSLARKSLYVLKTEGVGSFIFKTRNYLRRQQGLVASEGTSNVANDSIDYFGYNFFDFTRFRNLIKNGSYKGVYVLGSWGLGWYDQVKQRHHHIAEFFMKKGYLVICAMNPVHDADNTPFMKQMSENLLLVNFYNRWVSTNVLRMLALEFPFPKIYHIVGTDVGTSYEDLKWLKSMGFSVEFEISDEISPEIFAGITAETVQRYEKVLKDEDIVVVTTADKLYEKVTKYRQKNVLLSPNGATVSDWLFPKNTEICPPEELKKFVEEKKKIVGFYGSFGSWLDYEYIKYLAQARRDYEIVLIGYDYDNGSGGYAKSEIQKETNITVIPAKPYKMLKYYSHFFDVAILPFRQYGLTDSVSPVKIFEHMAQQIPVVSTDIRECRKYPDILISKSKDDFVKNVDLGIKLRKDKEFGKKLVQCAENNSWESRAEPILALLENHQISNYLYDQPGKLLSVIVPAYNMQRYLSRCLDTLSYDAFKKCLEILVINDGSSDSTLDIANFYSRKFPDVIKVIDKSNGGHGSCINKGIQEASGQYIKLVDSDDFLDAEALLQHIIYLRNCKEDVVITNYKRFYEDGHTERVSYEDRLEAKRIYNPTEFYRALLKDRSFVSYAHMHSITYKTNLLKKQNIKITEKSAYVDQEYITFPLIQVRSVSYQPVYLYHYFIGRPGQSVDPKVARKKSYMNLNIIQNIKKYYLSIEDKTLKSYVANILLHQTLYWMSCSDNLDAKLSELEFWKQMDNEIFSILETGEIK